MNESTGLTQIIPIAPDRPPRITLLRGVAPALSPEAVARWAVLCAANPRFHDGPILSVVSIEPDASEITVRRDRYARLAVQPQVHTGVRLLGVTAVLTASDAAGRAHVLLARRGEQVRLYAGLWELGPSGGVACPAGDAAVLDFDDLLRSLADEIEEEVGLPPPVSPRVVAIARDHRAMSDDVVITGDMGSLEAASEAMRTSAWEYREACWIPLDAVAAFDSTNEIIAPSRGILRLMGWLPGA
ncbi:MAG: hypothetical protein IPM33_04885 [Phycisphaerales bacterium]|nr:hypothetical protein [Phycisphaerales bacterium]